MNYGELKTAVPNWLANSTVTPVIGDVVRLAVAVIDRDVRVRAMEKAVTGTLVDGVAALPADYLESRNLVINGEVYDYITPERYQLEQSRGGVFKHFTAVGLSLYVVGGGSGAYTLTYVASFPALTADTDTNWLLTNAPDVHLYACLKQAAVFVKDAAAAQGYEALYQDAKNKVNSSDRASRFNGMTSVRGAA